VVQIVLMKDNIWT